MESINRKQVKSLKNASNHFQILTGGRGYGKNAQIIMQLQQENNQLKVLIENLKNGIALNEQQEKLLDNILFEDNVDSDEIIYFYNIKDDKYYRSRYTHKWLYNLEQESRKLKKQLKQRDEVIDETIAFCNYLLENSEVEINNEKYFKHSCDDIITNAILTRLKRYKGDEK